MKVAVYSPNWIGDSVLALPFIKHLKNYYPNAKIYIFCKEWVSGIYKNHPDIDQIIAIKKDSLETFLGTIKCGLELRSTNLNSFYTLTDSFRSALILRASGALARIGYKSQMRSFLLTDSISKTKAKIHRSKKFVGLLGDFSLPISKPELHISKDEKEWGLKEMIKLGIYKPIGLLPFSVDVKRTISNSIINKWIKGSRNDYVVFGSINDIEKGESLIRLCRGSSIQSICGRYSLRQSIILISLCKYTLATDSGLGHISAALGVPTISFFGKGSPEITSPMGRNVKIIEHCYPCLEKICDDSKKGNLCLKKIHKLDIEHAVKNLTKL